MNGIMKGKPPIIAAGLTKRYRDVLAVSDLSLNIKRGEIYGFLGLNGAGKTTTIRMMLGMIKPNAGVVSLFGTDIRPGVRSVWGRVGYMVETPHAYPDLTVRGNLELVQRLRRLDDDRAVSRIIHNLGLTTYASRRTGTLSLGNAQRLGLAKALIHEPELLILDEPANGLDPAGIVEIRNLLLRLVGEEGVTIFISSHILSEVARLATRIGIIHEGRLVKELTARELEEQEERRLVVEVGDPEAAQSALERAGYPARRYKGGSLVLNDKAAIRHPDEIATLLVQQGYPPTGLMVEKGDLESYFMELVGTKGGSGDD